MLTELYVENFGLIEKSNIKFSPGLNVLTGETGAGKSLIIDAVGLLIGGRGSQDFIRTGAEKLMLQGVFEGIFPSDLQNILSEAGFSCEEGSIVLNRELSRSGKNTCRINFRMVPLSFYKEVGKKLINIHGQHEHVNLLEDETQMLLLDNYGGAKALDLKEEVRAAFLEMKKTRKHLEELQVKYQDAAKKEDFLNFQIKEIDQANLMINEDELLEKERKILKNAERIASDSKLAYDKLYGARQAGACDIIRETVQLLKDVALMDENVDGIFQKLNEMYYLLEDVAREIGAYSENILSDPYRLEEIEQRLILIKKLKKKYGATIEEILNFYLSAKQELAELEHQEENFQELGLALTKEEEKFQLLTDLLTEVRKTAAKELSQAVTEELHQLHMNSAQFLVNVSEFPAGVQGKDHVGFLVSPNFGEEMKPVEKIASGGELSRIMLGIKVILSQLDQIPTLIFDEIDSGLGGKAVYDVAEKLKTIALSCQVICVTHSPVIASFAEAHLKIHKKRKEDRTVTEIETLRDEKIVRELSRMLAGDNISDITIAQAKELLKIGHHRNNK